MAQDELYSEGINIDRGEVSIYSLVWKGERRVHVSAPYEDTVRLTVKGWEQLCDIVGELGKKGPWAYLQTQQRDD